MKTPSESVLGTATFSVQSLSLAKSLPASTIAAVSLTRWPTLLDSFTVDFRTRYDFVNGRDDRVRGIDSGAAGVTFELVWAHLFYPLDQLVWSNACCFLLLLESTTRERPLIRTVRISGNYEVEDTGDGSSPGYGRHFLQR